jgi:hypothetical protein
LSGIFIKENGNNTGLFATLAEGAEVRNLKIADSCVYTSGSNAGVIAGENYGKITNVSVSAGLTSKASCLGAIAGKNYGEISCSASCGIVEGNFCVGGIAGANFGTISYSYTANDGIISYINGTSKVGGIAGENHGSISYSYSTASFKDAGFGIVGATVYGSEMKGCYYLSEADDGYEGTEKMSRESFLSGEVTYLLNEGGEVFFQTVGKGLPSFAGERVFKRLSYNCPGDESPNIIYTNENLDIINYPEHHYTSECDRFCSFCDFERNAEEMHTYVDICAEFCSKCEEKREAPHSFDNDCDATCDLCGKTRETEHIYDNSCDFVCNSCGYA